MKALLFGVLLSSLFTGQLCNACSVSPIEVQKVTPDLAVSVTHHGKPIAGISVLVHSQESPESQPSSQITDEKGVVIIRGLMPGKYYLTASHRDFEAGKAWIEVTLDPNAKPITHFDFEWAEGSYQIRRVEGQLSGKVPGNTGNPLQNLIHPQSTTYAGTEITLQDAFGTTEYHTVSDSIGKFSFDHLADGIYILRIAGGMDSLYGTVSDTSQVIDLFQSSKTDFLALEVKPSGCGASYFDLKDTQ